MKIIKRLIAYFSKEQRNLRSMIKMNEAIDKKWASMTNEEVVGAFLENRQWNSAMHFLNADQDFSFLVRIRKTYKERIEPEMFRRGLWTEELVKLSTSTTTLDFLDYKSKGRN